MKQAKENQSARKRTPRRASKRWLDADCPAGVLAIFDHPRYIGRYTVFYRRVHGQPPFEWIWARGMSARPSHPQGFGIDVTMTPGQVARYRRDEWRHSCRWSALPEAVKNAVRGDLAD